MIKQLPVIKIEIISTTDTKRSKYDILSEFQDDLENTYGIDVVFDKTSENPSLNILFSSKELFLTVYERDMSVYGCILENIINHSLNLEEYFEEAKLIKKSHDFIPGSKINYIVLKYSSNWKDPMRRNYQLTTRVDNLFGIQSAIEEVEDGFLKFYRTREDFEDSKLDNLSRKGWETWLKLKGIALSSNFAQNFFIMLEKKSLLHS